MDTVANVQSADPPTHLPARLPAAVSTLVTDTVMATTQPARVLGVFPTAVYLGLARHDTVLPLLASDALALPTGIRLGVSSHELTWPVRPGDPVEVGDGQVRLGSVAIHAARTWSPARLTAAPPDAQPLRLDRRSPLRGRVAHVVRRPDEVGTLVGLGAGLTPSGDDALCGALLALRASGSARLDPVCRAVADRLDRTTSLSASLLRAAIEGYAVPCVVRLASALAAGDRLAAEAALPQVLAIGHSSGADVVAGLLGAFDALGALDALGAGAALTGVGS